MRHRLLRAAVLLLALGALAGLAYRYHQVDQQALALETEVRAALADAARPAAELAQLRIALLSMIAPGQSVASWSQQVSARIAALRAEAGRLPADGGVQPPGSVSASLDKLAALERRARAQAMEGQALLASDIAFSEAGPVLDGLADAFAASGDRQADAVAAASTALARQRQMLAGAAAGVGLLAALLLLPLPRDAAPPADLTAAAETVLASADAPAPVVAVPTPAPELKPTAPAPPPAPAAAPPTVAVGELARTASVCADLARVNEGPQLASALARVGGLLSATGVTLWVADAEGRQLQAAAWYGYEAKVFEELGPISRDAKNLVAAAFRGPATRTIAAVPGVKAAVAVPVPGIDGPVGVLSAELADGVSIVPSTTAALAGIVAAQLATLVSPRPNEDLGGSVEGTATQQARG
jgi:hypothetical protein